MRQLDLNGRSASLLESYQNQKDEAYNAELDERDNAFCELNLKFFSALGYDKMVGDIMREFPLFREKLDIASFSKANIRKEEGADLFVQTDPDSNKPQTNSMAFKILPEQFQDISSLNTICRREFLYVHDMLDPDFEYKPSLETHDKDRMATNLIQDRHKVLWRAYVETRLAKKHPDYKPIDLTAQMSRVFPNMPGNEIEEILGDIKTRKWNHSELIAISKRETLAKS